MLFKIEVVIVFVKERLNVKVIIILFENIGVMLEYGVGIVIIVG